jgi:ABC-type multidrug transport system fused ATPase/permease subunit
MGVTVRTAIARALALLSPRDRRLLLLSMLAQVLTALMDLAGILLIGLIGALAVSLVQSQPPPAMVVQVTDQLGLDGLSGEAMVAVLAGLAAAVLLGKSIVSSILTRRVFQFLANRQALVSARLSEALLSQPLTFLQKRSSQETAFALITGAGAATIQILGQLTIAVTEIALLLTVSSALLLINPGVAIGAVLFFSIVAVLLQRAMGRWASRVGAIQARAEIASLNAVQEAISAYREIFVADRRGMYVERIQRRRWEAARVASDIQFLGMLPKYMFEAALVVGGFLLAGYLFATDDAVMAVGTLALFIAAASRVMPSLLRLQVATLGLRTASGTASPTFDLAEELGSPTETRDVGLDGSILHERILRGYSDLEPTIHLNNVSFTYPGTANPALHGVSLDVSVGMTVALVGPSGAGKSTLADVILGILVPSQGEVLIGGETPAEAIRRWPGGVAYVPQSVSLSNDSVRANVALGLPDAEIDDELVWRSLEQAHLAETIRNSRDGLRTVIGESGVRLSGGQRQRLGIARALYTRPRVVVFDEATSALDAETEAAISETLSGLEGTVTTVVVAHRLSTVRHAQLLVYLDHGVVAAAGTFDELVKAHPAFARQAALMGL